ncbi:sugar ABC transporter substrate-binding protein [Paroceanicella profunda]|uniref:Sugar ABC transporter substrate-binding protein n=1 Tax=Paroceanicella profunda TaxID=2579971 RepID=A0A5B8G0F5_9RHOB|nr:substrate-binding domain-containing protein [Paroceanicella profunda]QDL92569.1 sugar ABC transporter substrate-binding protein [Paroceanicella profunda]
MFRLLAPCLLLLVALAPPAAQARMSIGLAMGNIDAFQSKVADGVSSAAGRMDAAVTVTNAERDSDRLLRQVEGHLAANVDVLIVVLTDSDVGPRVTSLAQARNTPVVFVNSEPANINELPANQIYVGSDERDSGTLQAREVCRMLGGKGRIGIMTGELTHFAARQRTVDVQDVIATPECKGLELVEQQSGLWSRTHGETIMREWLAADLSLDAVIANNDEMALGAIAALQDRQAPAHPVIVAGIDATGPALAAMRAGSLAVTVLQNATAQGDAAVDTARRLVAGEEVKPIIYVPFELVTAANIDRYDPRN